MSRIIDLDGAHEAEAFSNYVTVREKDNVILYTLRGTFNEKQIKETLRVFDVGKNEGEQTGRKKLQAELRELLGVEVPW